MSGPQENSSTGADLSAEAAPADPSELVGLAADERLAAVDTDLLPAAERFTGQPRRSRGHGAIVATGTTLTAVSLIGGSLLAVAGIIAVLASGASPLKLAAIVLGAVLAATHWGWVHVAEASANALDERANRDLREQQRNWLHALAPHSRWTVTTTVLDDGSIRIERVHYRPVRLDERTFTFTRDLAAAETHGPDEPSAGVVEHAEAMRRHAALDTQREEQRWRIAADAYTLALTDAADHAERRAAEIAASTALSDQINKSLREPPLND